MSDTDEIEGEGAEGEEEEEGGESEKEEEEVKVEPTPAPYVPKINPLTQIQNINRNLDMLNSEVNVISSEFMVMSSQMGHTPQYYNLSPSRPAATALPRGYASPVRSTVGPTSYWNNPNHITLSPNKYAQPALYEVPNKISSPNPYRTSGYTAPVGNAYNNYSPSRYIPPTYAPPIADPAGDIGRLLNNIDNVLNQPISAPVAAPPPAPVYVPPPPVIEPYNTFEREIPPVAAEPPVFVDPEPRRVIVTEQKPPLYQRSLSHSRKEDFRRIEDMYNRKPPISRYNIANTANPEPRAASPLRRTRREMSPHFQRPHSVSRPASDFEIKDAVKTLFR